MFAGTVTVFTVTFELWMVCLEPFIYSVVVVFDVVLVVVVRKPRSPIAAELHHLLEFHRPK